MFFFLFQVRKLCFVTENLFKKPLYVYAVETMVCACHISLSHSDGDSSSEIRCFLAAASGLTALAVDPRSDWLFYSDFDSKKIYRIAIDLNKKQIADDGLVISASRGNVNGKLTKKRLQKLHFFKNRIE